MTRVLIDNVDKHTNAVLTIDYAHHEIHDGSSFTTDHTVELGNGAVIDVQLLTPDSLKYCHLLYTILCELEAEVKVYEGITSTVGTGLTIYNRDRNSGSASGCVAVHTPSVTGTGVLLRTKHFGTGKAVGGQTHDADEWILKANTKYLFRLTNATTSANYVTIMLNWYEHTNKG